MEKGLHTVTSDTADWRIQGSLFTISKHLLNHISTSPKIINPNARFVLICYKEPWGRSKASFRCAKYFCLKRSALLVCLSWARRWGYPTNLYSLHIYFPKFRGKLPFSLSLWRFSAAVKPPPSPALAQPFHSDWHCLSYRVAQDQLLPQDLALTKCPELLILVQCFGNYLLTRVCQNNFKKHMRII